MTAHRRPGRRGRGVPTCLLAVLAGLTISACNEVETQTSAGYEPVTLGPAKTEGEDTRLVKFTAEAAARTRLRTERVRRDGTRTVVPYEALIYDEEGHTFVFTSPAPLTYRRRPVKVARIAGDRVLLSAGPRAGTTIVTVGAAEVYGAEQEIAGSH
jgi:hypothetical protein